ncbi:periplasmic protein-like protein [Methylocella silvestris BL2]|uniref:Periplasmic protein-like protein n=1 Tax=Methylocella silvestris (strain DSM 15510 / CIP 108128 / LMG 27833 / NCIMB 13906 / BL2) TaxID=395965 RepID=B8ELS0_METSB|nr:periplasmic protein-like protein [Methylocella silvestris]ACK50701.1 periplasmic protein-like protein [Methylocella silvestris BL2]
MPAFQFHGCFARLDASAPPTLRNSVFALLTLCLAAFAGAAPAAAMSFRSVGHPAVSCRGVCGPIIAAEGRITDETPAEFLAFLRSAYRPGGAHGALPRPIVLLDSQGGKIVAGMELGKAFRKFGVTAIVASAGSGDATPAPGVCYSACVYALMGAATRIVAPSSAIGVHRMFAYNGGARHFATGEMMAALRRYSRAMGVSTEVIAAAEQIGPDSLRILTPGELARWGLASAGS